MAVFKKFTGVKSGSAYHSGSDNTGLVINPNNDAIWINSNAYDHSTLYPLFDKPCSVFKSNVIQSDSAHSFTRTNIIAKAPCLQNGQNSAVSHDQNKSSYNMLERDCNLEDNKTLTSSSRLFHFTSSSNKDFYLYTVRSDNASYESNNYYFVEGNDFSNPDAVTYGSLGDASGTQYANGAYAPVYVDTVSKAIYFVTKYSPSSSNVYNRQTIGRMVGIAKANYTTVEDDGNLSIGTPSSLLISINSGFGVDERIEPNNFYYCGNNNDNSLMFFEFSEVANANDPRYYNISTHLGLDRTSALLVAESVVPSSGTVSSVASLTASNLTNSAAAAKKMFRARPTSCVSSPISGEDNIYYSYYPVCDANNNITFIIATWDKSANSNAGSVTIDNCTMNYSGADVVTDYLTYPAVSESTVSTVASNSFVTVDNGNYYLHYLPQYGTPNCAAAQSSTAKNLVTYQINSTDFSELTFHSATQVNALGFVHLTADRKSIAVISPGQMTVMQWNSGWTTTATETGNFTGVTQDSNGRILAISSAYADTSTAPTIPESASYSYIEQKVHLISDSLPSTVTIDFADSSLTYSGSNLSTSVNINAYDSSSARIAKSVELKIDGANAQFTSNSSTSITVNTTTSAAVNVPVTVTGPGPISISAAFSL